MNRLGGAGPHGFAMASGPSRAAWGGPPATHGVGHDGFRAAPWIGCHNTYAMQPVYDAGQYLREYTCLVDGYRACCWAGVTFMGIPSGARLGRPMDDRPGSITE